MSAIRNRNGEGDTPPKPSSSPGLFNFISSVRFAIFLLSFIAVCCIAGTLVPQQAPPEQYLSRYSETTYGFLASIGLTDVFHAPWFMLAVGLFGLNLISCTADRLVRFVRNRRTAPNLDAKMIGAMPLRFFVPGGKAETLGGLFKGYRRGAATGNAILLEKGGIARYGVYVIHGSIVLILIGSLIGLIWGYRGFMTLTVGQTKNEIVKRASSEKLIPLGFGIKCSDFKVTFYPGGEPKDYMSRIEIINNGKGGPTAEVRVNHPAQYRGTNIYQASYGTDPTFVFDIGGEEVKLVQGDTYEKGPLSFIVMRFEQSVHNFGPGVQLAYLHGDNPKAVWFLKNVPRLREQEIVGVRMALKDIVEEPYTGLEITHDPGVPVVWTGFALILFGLYINFFIYHRRIYMVQHDDGVLVAGASPKNREAFREEFEKLRGKANGVAQ